MRPDFRVSRVAGLLLTTAVIGWLDYATGPNIAFSLVYLIPVVVAAWLEGARAAVLLAVLASTGWFVADYLWHHTSLAITSWNTFTRLSIFVAIGMLIAGLRRNQRNLERANEQLESFSRSVSHDLRSPLIQISRYSELLAGPVAALDDAARRHLSTISRAASDGLQLVDDLLRFAQMYRAEILRVPVDLNRVVAAIRADLAPVEVGRTIRWSVAVLPTVRADPAMMQIALRNLLENAVKYTRPREEAVIEVSSYEERDSVVVRVRDNGVGFNPQYMHKLFHVFERLHGASEFEGNGIGLALVREIVVRHGGRVWADAQLDAGATFYVSLPRSL
ncbi:MAG TPA: ATP-binding protein [Thermoanaerobaculia bacterium]|nr:ATP-binding protein [Thermoanaerobaculia bacterium]